MRTKHDLQSISDDDLLHRLAQLLAQSRRVEADLVAHIGEVDARRLYAREAAPSMFHYCTEILHLSEPEAALRIRAARVCREHPALLAMLRDGRIHLSGIAVLAPVLTPENRGELLRRAAHRSKRQIQELVAELLPRPDAPTTVRKLPAGRVASPKAPAPRPQQRPDAVGTVGHAAAAAAPRPDRRLTEPAPLVLQRPDAVVAPAKAATVEPLAPARFKVTFTASGELREKLERLQALMRSSVPDGDLVKIIDVAVRS